MNAVCVYDFRYNGDVFTPDDIKGFLTGIAKSYTFQKEKGDSGYIHYQGRISLIKKRRKMEALKLFTSPPNYFEPTSNPEYLKGDAFYQMKLDTRIDGPWTDQDEVKFETKQLKIFNGLQMYPYQEKLMQKATEFCMRTIDLVYDPNGNIGKSIFSEYLENMGICEEIPPYRLMDDIFAWVCSRPIKKCYIIDMPRGMKKDKLGDFYSGIEVIKNGVAYDKRYTAKKIRFDRPRIFVFTNTLPVLSLMSLDRWRIWTVSKEYDLVPYGYHSEDVCVKTVEEMTDIFHT